MLGRGASGFVQLALDRHTGKHVAIKFIRHGQGFESRIVARELINQRMCYAHPHIVQLQVCNPPRSLEDERHGKGVF